MSSEKVPDVTVLLSRVKTALGIKKDVELAEFLGVSQHVVSMWKKRNNANLKLILEKCNHLDAEWLLTGKGEMSRMFLGDDDPRKILVTKSGSWELGLLSQARKDMLPYWTAIIRQDYPRVLMEILSMLGYTRAGAEEEVQNLDVDSLAKKTLDLFLIRCDYPMDRVPE